MKALVPALLLAAGAVSAQPIIDPSRTTTWNPGLNSVGGIPNYTNITATLSPLGGAQDDTLRIQTALDACQGTPAQGNVVKLNPGTFNINGNGLAFTKNYCVLRGSGTGTPLPTTPTGAACSNSGAGGTKLIKADRLTNLNYEILGMGFNPSLFISSTNLAADAVKGTTSLTLTSVPVGLSAGELVLVDHITNDNESVSGAFWGPTHDPAGTTLNSAMPSSTGGTLSAGTYYYQIAAINAATAGLSIASNELSATIPVGVTIGSVSLSWNAVPSATGGYNIYRGTTAGGENLSYTSTTSSFIDVGATSTLTGAPPAGSSRNWFVRQGRSISQIMEVTAISGNTITFATPFHTTFKTALGAQLSRYGDPNIGLQPFMQKSGVEDIYFCGGMGGDGHGNIAVGTCAYCWIKNIESHWAIGTQVGFYGTYRSVLRDSYIHETGCVPTPPATTCVPDANPGGSGYLVGINTGAADNLFENNIMWNGNKVIVMRGSGGGNVIGYNYMDDAWITYAPHFPEAGINAGHYTTPHMELLEGNRSHKYTGDSYWGNSIYITAFRSHFPTVRGAIPPLNNYTTNQAGTIYPYRDIEGRTGSSIEYHSTGHNLVGNVFGTQGQTLLSYTSPTYTAAQTSWLFEGLTSDPFTGCPFNCAVPMWVIGGSTCGPAGCPAWDSTTVNTIQRDGNWDFVTNSQTWCSVGGSPSYPSAGTHLCNGTPQTIPNSLYLTATPPFFGPNQPGCGPTGCTWPWVQPESATNPAKVFTLPAKARFDAMSH
jgi:hypothetical protein